MKPTIPHLDWPVRVTPAGHFASNDQDTIEDVATCVAVSLMTPPGWRALEPEFGTALDSFPLLPIDVAALATRVQHDEPRAALVIHDDPSDYAALKASLEVRVRLARSSEA